MSTNVSQQTSIDLLRITKELRQISDRMTFSNPKFTVEEYESMETEYHDAQQVFNLIRMKMQTMTDFNAPLTADKDKILHG